MAQTYEQIKKSILKYQKTSEKYKAYKKEYDTRYRLENSCYATYRSVKSTMLKRHGIVEGLEKLLSWARKRDSKNNLCDKTRNKLKELI